MKTESVYTADDKLRWEIEKLQAETRNLKRAWISNPASWFTVITAIVALSGVAIQYVNADADYQLKQIEKGKLELETGKLSVVRQQLEREIAVAQDGLAKLKASLADSSQASRQLQESEDTFTTLSAALKSDDTSAQFVSVIATLRTPNLAVKRANGLRSTRPGLKYPVEVYRKAAGQYTLTFGGKSTYLEASRRVEYARQNGFPDAVVRLAKNWGTTLVN